MIDGRDSDDCLSENDDDDEEENDKDDYDGYESGGVSGDDEYEDDDI